MTETNTATISETAAKVLTGGMHSKAGLTAMLPVAQQPGTVNRTLISRLVAQEEPMELQTREAMLLFIGRAAVEEHSPYGVPGARHAARALGRLFILTAHDNPYADWILSDTDARVQLIKELIAEQQQAQIIKLEELKAKGLPYTIVRAQKSQSVHFDHYSPYGSMMNTVVLEYDYLIRVLTTANRKDLISSKQRYTLLIKIKHEIRSMFSAAIRAASTLTTPEMRGLSRSDFLPECSEPDAAKRIEAARKIFGVVPEDIFTGKVQPRHTMRRSNLSEAEQKLLDDVAQSLDKPDTPAQPETAYEEGLVH